MTIEFHCTNCNKLLRTSDDRAGARAKCPDCGTAITVPQAAGGAGGGLDDFDLSDEDARDADRYGTAFTPERPEPQRRSGESGYAGEMKNCPMCGAEIRAAAVKCRFCGENLGTPAGGTSAAGTGYPTKIDAGEVISTSWEIFKSQMGLLVGGAVVFILIMVAVAVVLQVIQTGMLAAVMGGGGGFGRRPQMRPGNLGAILVVTLVSALMNVLINSFFNAGWSLFFVNVAKGANPEIGNLFGGGPYFLRVLGNTLLLGLAFFGMYVVCIVPAIFLGQKFLILALPLVLAGAIVLTLMYWPFQYVIVDENAPHQNALARAKELTSGNWGAVFLLGLAALAFNLLGMLAFCVGLLFSIPLTTLMFAVAYARMAGHRTAIDR